MSFPESTLAFLKDLEANNSRNWFEANRDRYEAEWLAPAKALVEELAPRMAQLDPPHKATPKLNGSIRRINRDTRFSKDKRPYDPRIFLIFWTGEKPQRSPALYLALRTDGLRLGVGQWAFTKEELARYRDAISDKVAAKELQTHIDRAANHGFTLAPESLKRVPSGTSPLPEHETLAKRKGLVIWSGDAPKPAIHAANTENIWTDFEALAPVNDWLTAYVSDA